MSEPMIKGVAIREFMRWYGERYGVEPLREMQSRVADDLQHLVDPADPGRPLLAASWYPARFVHALLDGLAERHMGAELDRIIKDGTRFVVKQTTNGVYRFLLENMVTPDMYALSVPRLWGQLQTTGRRRIKIAGPGEATSIVSAWRGHHPLLCTITIATMCGIFEMMGCRDVRWERIECVSEGGQQCVAKVRWR